MYFHKIMTCYSIGRLKWKHESYCVNHTSYVYWHYHEVVLVLLFRANGNSFRFFRRSSSESTVEFESVEYVSSSIVDCSRMTFFATLCGTRTVGELRLVSDCDWLMFGGVGLEWHVYKLRQETSSCNDNNHGERKETQAA